MATVDHAAIADRVCDEAISSGARLRAGSRRATLDRVRTLVKDVGNPAEVEAVCRYAAREDAARFSPTSSLKWISYEFVRQRVGAFVPDDCWRFMVMLLNLERDHGNGSHEALEVRYWLMMLRDGVRSYNATLEGEARHALARIYSRIYGGT